MKIGIFGGSLDDLMKALGDDGNDVASNVDPRWGSKMSAYVGVHAEAYDRMMTKVVDVQTEFSSVVKELRHDFESDIGIVRESRATSVWSDYIGFAPWSREAVGFLVTNMNWLAAQNIFGIGAGRYPAGNTVIDVSRFTGDLNEALDHARSFVQNSMLEGPRQRDDMLFYLYYLGKFGNDDVDACRIFAVAMSKCLLDISAREVRRDRAEKNKAGNEDGYKSLRDILANALGISMDDVDPEAVKKNPAWMHNLFSPSHLNCPCQMCQLKRIDISDTLGYITRQKPVDDEDRKAHMRMVGELYTSKFLSAMTAARLASLPNTSFEVRAKIQAFLARYVGMPMILDREEMLRVASDPVLWSRFTTWGDDEKDASTNYKALTNFVHKVLLSTRKDFTAKGVEMAIEMNEIIAYITKAMEEKDDLDDVKFKALYDRMRHFMDEHRQTLKDEGMDEFIEIGDSLVKSGKAILDRFPEL